MTAFFFDVQNGIYVTVAAVVALIWLVGIVAGVGAVVQEVRHAPGPVTFLRVIVTVGMVALVLVWPMWLSAGAVSRQVRP